MIKINMLFGFTLGIFLQSQGMGITTYQYWVILLLAIGAVLPWSKLKP